MIIRAPTKVQWDPTEAAKEQRNSRTGPLVSKASQSPVPVGKRPICRHFHTPIPNPTRWKNKNAPFWRNNVVTALGSFPSGAYCAKALFANGLACSEENSEGRLTFINLEEIHKGTPEKHDYDSHTEYLHLWTRHIQHDEVHWYLLRWLDSNTPCSWCFEGI